MAKNDFWNGERPPSWILKMFIWSSGCYRVWTMLLCTKFHQKLDDFSLSYGDLTICNIADIGHLEFSKFGVYVTWPLSSCYSVSSCKISLKSGNRLLSYGQKNDFFKRRPSAILNFKNVHLVIWLSSSSKCTVVYQISSNFVEIWRFHDFQDGRSPASWILGSNDGFFEKPIWDFL